MIRYSGSVLFFDNTCLVYLFDDLYYSNRQHLHQVMAILSSEFDAMWIPHSVKEEFLLKRNDKKRKKLLKWALQNFTAISVCPIPVSKPEIVSLIGNTEENSGEADALLQMNKGRVSEVYNLKKLTFFTQDKGAIRMIENHSHHILDYDKFKSSLLESGIILP